MAKTKTATKSPKRVKPKVNPTAKKPKKTAFGYGASEKKTRRSGKV